MKEYIPKIGDSIAAKRKVKSKIYNNLVVGPVYDTWDNACRVTCNLGEENETTFKLYFNEWDFTFLFRTDEDTE